MKEKLLVEIIRTRPDHDNENESLEQEAEALTDALLDAHGYPPKLSFEIRVISKQLA